MSVKQLDIDKIYELYEKGDEDPDFHGIAGEIESVSGDTYGYLQQLASIWEENIHFYEGDQYIYFDDKLKKFQPFPVTKFTDFVPRPVTNFIFPIVNTISSLLTRNKPQASVIPNSDEDGDKNRAKLADVVIDAKWEIDNEALNYLLFVQIAMLCGTVYRKDYWDTSGLASIKDSGGKKIPLGDNEVGIRTPFEVIPDINSFNNMDDGLFVLEQHVQSLSWIQSNYDRKGNGYTGMASKVRENTSLSTLLTYSERLKTSAGSGGHSDGSTTMKNSATVTEAYIRPIRKHPKGLLVVIADNKVLYIGDSPYVYGSGDNWHPYTEFKYQLHGFRHHGLTLVEHLVPLQRRINSIDALIILTRMTMASPIWLIPNNCLVSPGVIVNRPGFQLHYKPGIGGTKPETIYGKGLDSSVWKERQEAVQEMHIIAGDNEVLQGIRPAGVNTASGLNMLLEQSYGKFSPMVEAWEKFIEKGQTKKINLIRNKYKEPRKEFARKLKMYNKDILGVQIDDFFTGKDLGDNVDVRVEAGSSLPRSKVVEQSQLQELAGMGMLGQLDPMSNPVGNGAFLKKFGVNKFPTQNNRDVDRAKWENDLIRQKAFEQVKILESDDDKIHMDILDDVIKRPEFDRLEQEVQEVYFEHRAAHEESAAQKQAAAMQAQMEQAMQQQMAMMGANTPAAQPQATESVSGGQGLTAPASSDGLDAAGSDY